MNGNMRLATRTNVRRSYDPVWRALQPNDIGTDEFMTLCKLLGVEPYITVNAGTGDDWSAAGITSNTATATPPRRWANSAPPTAIPNLIT